MMGVGLYSCSTVERPSPAPSIISAWSALRPRARRRLLGFGTGVISAERRRASMIRLVGCPSSSSSQWRAG